MNKKLENKSKERKMAKVGEETLKELVELLEDEDPIIRTNATFYLGVYAYSGFVIKSALPKLVKLLDDEDKSVRLNATCALVDYSSWGLIAKSALPKLVKLLDDEDESVRDVAACALGDYASAGLTDKSVPPKLVKLGEKNKDMRVNIRYALGEYAKRRLKNQASAKTRKTTRLQKEKDV